MTDQNDPQDPQGTDPQGTEPQGSEDVSFDQIVDGAMDALQYPKDGEVDTGAAPADPAQAQEPGTAPQGDPADQTELQPIEPPQHWDVDSQTMFRGLPAPAQHQLLAMSRGMEAAHTQRSQEIAPLRRVNENWSNYLEQIGDSPDTYFNSLAETERMLRVGTNEQKIARLAQLAEDYGIDFGVAQEPQINPSQDPLGIKTMLNQAVAPYAQQVEQITAQKQAEAEAAQQNAVHEQHQQIEAYRNWRDEHGNAVYPYFNEVEQDMAMLAQSRMDAGQPVTIPDLYEQACWINPAVRAKVQYAIQHHTAQQLAADNQKRQRAAGGLTGGGGSAESAPDTLDEAIHAAIDAVAAANG